MNPPIFKKEELEFIRNLLRKASVEIELSEDENKSYEKVSTKLNLIIEMNEVTEDYQKRAGEIRSKLIDLN